MKIIISGGGTGGHIFPAVSIGTEIRKQFPDAEILYVGATGGMEMELVPKSGFPIRGLWISGIQRSLTLKNIGKNLLFPLKLVTSLVQARQIVADFRPDVVVGVGGYASGPLGRAAAMKNIPLIICEQNAFPGITNKWLADKASKILLGNADALKYFDKNKCVITGNPIRDFSLIAKKEAAQKMGLSAEKTTILSLGGSLGAGKINEAIENNLQNIIDADIQWVWQCGKFYYENLKNRIPQHPNIKLMPFVEDMAAAYSVADLVVSRAGGSTISELIALSKPSILVPSPNVAEDHQTKNALSLVNVAAAVLVKDVEAKENLVKTAISIVQDKNRLSLLTKNIAVVEKHDAAKEIVREILKVIH